ncbi:MAG: hypothetical protein RMJ59_00740 [Candidatus Nitrosocaldus sp.]|nr:hypothetical protein [Candidatus Nitrosocaldus sp.]MCS7140821.1 hypothetical protein [Candidatus Nitrosocaldus sp.]MDW7999749.1 hypothetical protein [Candidatus Nitrosocaldus sp.]MDW8274891.1 hypothetical protein [Candidatus Nitrosocaldus sp.]
MNGDHHYHYQYNQHQLDYYDYDDDHYMIYGKRAIDVEYGEPCIFCNSRIDEFGFCACGAGGS